MSKTVKNILIFTAGLATGFAGGYIFARKYEVVTEDEEVQYEEDAPNPTVIEGEPVIFTEPVVETTSLTQEDVEKINEVKGESPIEYANKFAKKLSPETVKKEAEKVMETYANPDIYVIEPEEYGENEEYGMESLILTADGCVLTDRYELVTDPAELLGDCLEEMGKYEDDAVHIRNDIRMCDYEVLRDIKTYDEINELYSGEELTGNE